MPEKKHATILAVSEGWEDAYIQDEGAKWVYYAAAPDFKKVPIAESVLPSSLAYALLVPEERDFPSVDDALFYVKTQYETQDDPLIPFSEAVDAILDYAKAINHPLANKAVEKKGEHRLSPLSVNPPPAHPDD